MTLDPCPAPSELLQLVHRASALERDASRVERHVAGCDRCQESVRDLRQSIAVLANGRQSAPERGPDCLDANTVAHLADGSLPSSERAIAVAHLAACAHCRVELAEISSALHDPAVAGALRHTNQKPARRPARVAAMALLACAATALLVVSVRKPNPEATPQLRDDALPAMAPVAHAPTGSVAGLSPFRWSKVAGADLYHVTVFTNDGTIAWQGETSDTTLAAPATADLKPGVDYFWKVDARTEFDRWSNSRMMEFRVTGNRPR